MNKKRIGMLMIGAILILSFALVPFVACGPAAPGGQPIKVGVAGPMMDDPGKLMLNAALLAAEDINSAGGVNVGGVKRPLQVIKIDTNEMNSITDAVAAIEKAITVDKVNFLVGSYRSEATLAYQDKAMENKIIFIGAWSASPAQNQRVKENYNKYKYWFRTHNNVVWGTPFFNKHAKYIADILQKELGIQELKAVIVAEKAVYADPPVDAWTKALPGMGIKVMGTYRPSPVATDVTAELRAIKDSGAHIVMQMIGGPAGAVLGRQWGELQIPCVLTGQNGPAQSKAIWEATGGKAEYITTVSMSANAAATPKTQPFFKKYVEKFKEFPGDSACTYDAILVYVNAVEKAGTLDSDALVPVIEKTDIIGVHSRLVFSGMDSPFPHDLPTIDQGGYVNLPLVQWIKGDQVCVWPTDWQGAKSFQIPPWMVKQYKK